MQKILPIAVVASWAVFVFAQLPSTVPLATSHIHRERPDVAAGDWTFSIKGRIYHSTINHEQLDASPEWTPSAPLPLSLADAEHIAHIELDKFVSTGAAWQVSEFSIRPFRDGTQTRWFYVVRLKPNGSTNDEPSDHFDLPVSFSGQPGQIWGGEAWMK